MKLVFIKKNFLIYGNAENYMKTLIDRFRGKADIHIMARKWAETGEEGFVLEDFTNL